MEPTVYLTRYDALLCQDCALNTEGLLNAGVHRLNGLTALTLSEACEVIDEPSCEECNRPLRSLAVA